MFAFFERRIRPTAHPGTAPPPQLLARGPAGGPYARLWAHQSGGFLVEEAA